MTAARARRIACAVRRRRHAGRSGSRRAVVVHRAARTGDRRGGQRLLERRLRLVAPSLSNLAAPSAYQAFAVHWRAYTWPGSPRQLHLTRSRRIVSRSWLHTRVREADAGQADLSGARACAAWAAHPSRSTSRRRRMPPRDEDGPVSQWASPVRGRASVPRARRSSDPRPSSRRPGATDDATRSARCHAFQPPQRRVRARRSDVMQTPARSRPQPMCVERAPAPCCTASVNPSDRRRRRRTTRRTPTHRRSPARRALARSPALRAARARMPAGDGSPHR